MRLDGLGKTNHSDCFSFFVCRVNQTDFDELDGTKERIESVKARFLLSSRERGTGRAKNLR